MLVSIGPGNGVSSVRRKAWTNGNLLLLDPYVHTLMQFNQVKHRFYFKKISSGKCRPLCPDRFDVNFLRPNDAYMRQ